MLIKLYASKKWLLFFQAFLLICVQMLLWCMMHNTNCLPRVKKVSDKRSYRDYCPTVRFRAEKESTRCQQCHYTITWMQYVRWFPLAYTAVRRTEVIGLTGPDQHWMWIWRLSCLLVICTRHNHIQWLSQDEHSGGPWFEIHPDLNVIAPQEKKQYVQLCVIFGMWYLGSEIENAWTCSCCCNQSRRRRFEGIGSYENYIYIKKLVLLYIYIFKKSTPTFWNVVNVHVLSKGQEHNSIFLEVGSNFSYNHIKVWQPYYNLCQNKPVSTRSNWVSESKTQMWTSRRNEA